MRKDWNTTVKFQKHQQQREDTKIFKREWEKEKKGPIKKWESEWHWNSYSSIGWQNTGNNIFKVVEEAYIQPEIVYAA